MKRNIKYISSFLVAIFLALGAVFLLQPIASAKPATAPPPPPATAPTPTTTPTTPTTTTQPSNKTSSATSQPTSRQVMQRLLEHRPTPGSIAPKKNDNPISKYDKKELEKQNKINSEILGIAPGEILPSLMPEGSFIISRRGRLKPSPDGFHYLFVFEADSPDSPEAPMILLPSKKLENIELLDKKNSSPLFVISGQVHVYHGANYLMLTSFKIATERGNLNLRGH